MTVAHFEGLDTVKVTTQIVINQSEGTEGQQSLVMYLSMCQPMARLSQLLGDREGGEEDGEGQVSVAGL